MSIQSGRFFPLLVFICAGALLFGLEHWRNSQKVKADVIRISATHIDRLEATLELRYGRPASEGELDAEIEAFLDEELLYREALKLGLHLSDEVVRRRLAQTMAFIIEGAAELEYPTDSELRAWFDRERPDSTARTRIDFQHVFFSSERPENDAELEALNVLAELNSGAASASEKGDPFLLGVRFQGRTLAHIERDFGVKFAASIANAETGKWSGPIDSGYGRHLVLVEDRIQIPGPDFERQRNSLIKAWRTNRRHEIRAQALDTLRLEFDIEIERQRPTPGRQ